MIQRNLVYIINLPEEIAKELTLTSYEYFGQYGTIQKCIVSHSKNLQSRKPTCNAYITYSSETEASKCIRACNFFQLGSHVLEVTLGTTRYCTNFLNGAICPRNDCLFLHERKPDCEIFLKGTYNMHKRSMIYVKNATSVGCEVRRGSDTVLPQVRELTEEEIAERQLECEPESPDSLLRRTQSRFMFARGSEKRCELIDMVKANSPSKSNAHLSSDQYEDLMSPASSDRWAVDLFHAIPLRKSFDVVKFGEYDDVYLISPKNYK